MKTKWTKQEIEDLLLISTRNVQMLGNAIRQYESMAKLFMGKGAQDNKAKLSYLHRVHLLKLKQNEELYWVDKFKLALRGSTAQN